MNLFTMASNREALIASLCEMREAILKVISFTSDMPTSGSSLQDWKERGEHAGACMAPLTTFVMTHHNELVQGVNNLLADEAWDVWIQLSHRKIPY
jgi:hypothetical protein